MYVYVVVVLEIIVCIFSKFFPIALFICYFLRIPSYIKPFLYSGVLSNRVTEVKLMSPGLRLWQVDFHCIFSLIMFAVITYFTASLPVLSFLCLIFTNWCARYRIFSLVFFAVDCWLFHDITFDYFFCEEFFHLFILVFLTDLCDLASS